MPLVRRHSGASNVVIRLMRSGGDWTLSIDDDGRGFDFAGRLSQDALDAVRDISPTPLVLIHGDSDSIVPVEHAEQLFEAAREPKELWIVRGADHIGALRSEENRRRFVQLLDRAP